MTPPNRQKAFPTTSERLRKALKGVVAVAVAPFDNGTQRFNSAACAEITNRMIASGISAVTALGNTAEVYQLDSAERASMLRSVAEGGIDGVTIAGLAGSAREVLVSADLAASLGYDAVMLHEPLDPLTDGSGVMEYLVTTTDKMPLPVVLYVRSERLSRSHVAELGTHPQVLGVKYAKQDLDCLPELVQSPSGPVWINGSAESRVLSFAKVGITGFTSGLANVRPDIALAVHAAALRVVANRNGSSNPSSLDHSEQLLERLLAAIAPFEELRNRSGGRHNVSVVKQALCHHGFDVGGVRPPAMTAPEHTVARIVAALPDHDEITRLYPVDML